MSIHELTSFEEGGVLPTALLQTAVDALDVDYADHLHPRIAILGFNELGPGQFSTQQLPTLYIDEEPAQFPIEGDPSAVACPRQHLRLSQVLQLKQYCVDSRRCVPYRLDVIRRAKAASLSQAAQPSAGSRGLGLSIAAISRKGFAPGYKEDNQDRCMVVQPFVDATQVLFGVMDGHGVEGHRVSQYIKSSLPGVLRGHLLLGGQTPRKAYINTFHEVDSLMSSSSGIDAENSGSTAVLGLLQGKQLTTAWVGDSRGVLGYFKSAGQGGKPGGWRARDLSTDHKPEMESERRRILMCKGRVERTRNRQGQCMGCHRVWLPHANYPGLAMSRAIGDTVVRPFGVTCTPEITTHKLGVRDCFLVFASDGVWEYLSSQDVVELVGKQVGYVPEPEPQAPQGKAAWHVRWQEQQERRKQEQRLVQEAKKRQQQEREAQKAEQARQKAEQRARQKAEREAERKRQQEQQRRQLQEEQKQQQRRERAEQKQREQQLKQQQQQEQRRKQEEQRQLKEKQKVEQKQREQQLKQQQQQEQQRKQEEQRQRKQQEQQRKQEEQKAEQKQREQQELQRKADVQKQQQHKQKQREQEMQQEQEQRRVWQLRLQQQSDPQQRQQEQKRQQQEAQEQKKQQQQQQEEDKRKERQRQQQQKEQEARQRAEQQQKQRQQQQEQQQKQKQQQEEQKLKQKQQQEEQRQKQKQQQEEQKQKQKQQQEEQRQKKQQQQQQQKQEKAEKRSKEGGHERRSWRLWGRKAAQDATSPASSSTPQAEAKYHWGRLLGRVQQLKDGEQPAQGGGSADTSAVAQAPGTISAEEHDAAAMRACAALVAEARTRWEAEYNGQYIDDISAVVVVLHAQTNHQHQQQLAAVS